MRKFTCLIYAAFVASAAAGTYEVPAEEPLAALHIPDAWKTQEHGEYLEAGAPNGRAHLLIMAAERNKVAESMGEGDEVHSRRRRNQSRSQERKTRPGETEWKETSHDLLGGEGQAGRSQNPFSYCVSKHREPLLVAFWATPEAEKKYQGELKAILNSIQKR